MATVITIVIVINICIHKIHSSCIHAQKQHADVLKLVARRHRRRRPLSTPSHVHTHARVRASHSCDVFVERFTVPSQRVAQLQRIHTTAPSSQRTESPSSKRTTSRRIASVFVSMHRCAFVAMFARLVFIYIAYSTTTIHCHVHGGMGPQRSASTL